jgi:hypothetical protein
MKMNIVGFEVIAGTSQKTGKPYDMSKIHTVIPLAASDKASGFVGSSYDVPAHVLDKLKGVRLPAECDVNVVDVQQFGKRVQQVASISILSSGSSAERARAAA